MAERVDCEGRARWVPLRRSRLTALTLNPSENRCNRWTVQWLAAGLLVWLALGRVAVLAEPPPLDAQPPPRPIPTAAPAASQGLDVAQVAQNPALWPREVTLLKPTSFPVVYQGRVAGQTLLPAGSRVRLVRALAAQVETENEGARQLVATDATDLLARAARIRDSLAAQAAATVSPDPSLRAPRVRESAAPQATATPQAAANASVARAKEVTDALQRDFWNPQTGRYSDKPNSKDPGSAWSYGVAFSALAGAVRHDPARYGAVLRKSFTAFDVYWDHKQPLGGYEPLPTNGNGNDKYFDDNEWLALAFLEAYELTDQPDYSRRAAATMKFVLSGWDETYLHGGIWWHETHERKNRQKNTCANAPAAVACLRLARVSQPTEARELLAQARKITDWTVTNLELPNHLYADTRDIEGDGMNRASLTYNSALMLRAFLDLQRATGDASYLRRAQQIAVAAGSLVDQKTGVFHDHKKWAHLMVEADLALYRVTGESYLLQRARRQADAYYAQWKADGPVDLISAASVARTLWLLADTETAVGRAFWQKSDASPRFP